MVLVHYEKGCNKASTCGPGLFTNTDSYSVSASYAVPSKEIKVTCYYCKVAPRACVCVRAVFCPWVYWREGFWESCCHFLVWMKVQLGQSWASKYSWCEEALGWALHRAVLGDLLCLSVSIVDKSIPKVNVVWSVENSSLIELRNPWRWVVAQ